MTRDSGGAGAGEEYVDWPPLAGVEDAVVFAAGVALDSKTSNPLSF